MSGILARDAYLSTGERETEQERWWHVARGSHPDVVLAVDRVKPKHPTLRHTCEGSSVYETPR